MGGLDVQRNDQFGFEHFLPPSFPLLDSMVQCSNYSLASLSLLCNHLMKH